MGTGHDENESFALSLSPDPHSPSSIPLLLVRRLCSSSAEQGRVHARGGAALLWKDEERRGEERGGEEVVGRGRFNILGSCFFSSSSFGYLS